MTDNIDKVHFGSARMATILDFMIRILATGISIGGSKSQIVNYSNSQLKSHSIWMLLHSQIPELQMDRIIGTLGEFDEKEGALKMYSRRGQCFTTTKYITHLTADEITTIQDIKVKKTDDPEDPDGYYTFSDGCGNISRALCRLIDDRLGLYQCSAYQIRLGGAKGVLVCKPSLGEKERIVELR